MTYGGIGKLGLHQPLNVLFCTEYTQSPLHKLRYWHQEKNIAQMWLVKLIVLTKILLIAHMFLQPLLNFSNVFIFFG